MKRKQVLKEEVKKEIFACADDPVYFIEKYCKVRHQRRGLVPFHLYEYQKESIRSFVVHNQVIVNKARQLGFTTLTAAFITWLILFHKDKQVLCVSTKAEVAKEMIDRIKVMLNHLPDWMYLANVDINRAHKITLTNGSSVESVARSDDAGRSKSVALLVIDEAAIIRNMDEMWKGLKSTTSTGGKTIALSTPRGIGNWFQKTYMDALSGKNDWKAILVNWWECPEYAEDLIDDPNTPGGKTSTWFRNFTKDMSPMQIRQELLTEFLETGDTYFDAATVKFWTDNSKDPIAREHHDKGLWIWKRPEINHRYLISTDTSSGGSEDYSTFHVIDLNSLEVVAEYQGKLPPDIFAELIIEKAKEYNKAWIAADNANIGSVTCFHIKNSDYPNMVYLNKEFKLVDKWYAEYHSLLPGVPTDVRNRSAMVAKLEEYLRKKQITIYSRRFITEMHTFTVINGKPQAMKGDNIHDDLIMALAIGVWIRDIIPQFSGNFTGGSAAALYDAFTISKQTFNQKQVQQQQRIAEVRKKIEDNGFTELKPQHFNPYIYFTR
jgi:hypothetical protein